VVDIQPGDIGPGAAAEVLVLDMHRSAWPTGLRGVFAAASLNAGLFIGGDHEFVVLQCATLPLAGIQIQHPASLHCEFRIAWKDPTAVIPGSNGVFMEPTPERTTANGSHQAALADLPHQIVGAPARKW